MAYGSRCSGTIQQCILPWYSWRPNIIQRSVVWDEDYQTCEDHSAQVWPLNSACPNSSHYLEKLKNFYPGENYSSVAHYTDYKLAEDPHNCWDSCSSPGPNCCACTNKKYFKCEKSGVCVHPDLRCDGHPQCQHGEDEDVNICLDIWVKNKLVSAAASLKCNSSRYPHIYTVSVPCDGVQECEERLDEANCSEQSFANNFLGGSMAFIVLFYLGLKIYRINKRDITSSIIKR